MNAFMSLDEGAQRKALAGMSADAKQWLLTGVKARKSQSPSTVAPPPQKEDQGILKGFVDSAVGTMKGIKELFVPSTEPGQEGDVGKAVKDTYVEGGKQAKQQFGKGMEAARAGDVPGAAAKFGQAAVTGTSLLNPLATGSVVNANRAADEGRYREAIGAGAFDLLTLWGGKKIGSAPDANVRLNKLISGTGVDVADIERVLPEIEQASKQMGRAETIGDFKDIVDAGSHKLETEFQQALAPIKNQRIYAPSVRAKLDQLIIDNPNWAQTAEGRERITAVRRVQREYDRPWTLNDMNLERSTLRKSMRGMYNAAPSDATAKVKLDAELAAKKIVADEFADTVNSHVATSAGKSKAYFDALRKKQEAFINMQDHMANEIENLRNKQAKEAGKPLSEKVKPHAYASGAGPRVHVPFSEAVSEGPGELADSKVKSAFQRGGPQRGKKLARAGVLALPLSHLATAGPEAKKSRITPPPEPDEQ